MPGAFTLKGVELAQLARPARAAPTATFIAALSESAATPHAAVHTLGRRRFRNPRDFTLIDPGLITVRPDVPAAPGYDRAAATLPVADVQNPGDNIAFFAADGSATYYLPRYRLKQVAANRYDISVTEAEEGGFRLAVGLERAPPPELAALAGAVELPHEVIALMAFTTAAGLAKQTPLTELMLDEGGKVCGGAARLTLAERDALMIALQSASGARLLVRRAIKVSAQLPATGGSAPLPTQLILADVARPHLLAQLKVNPAIWSSVATAHISALPAAVATDVATPAPPPAAPRYHDVDLVLEQAAEPDPLVLDPNLHGYFYQGGPRAASTGALKRISIPYADGAGERHMPYFQDGDDPALFYYLPDAFRLGRDDTEPFLPEMAIRMTAPDGSIAGAVTTIDYAARPFTLPGRLKAALPTLAAAIPPTLASAGATPRLEPMPALAKLRLRVPSAAAVEMRAFDEVTVDVANGFRHSLTLPIDQFRQLFASAFSTDATSLFTGEVLVNTGRPSPEAVPVEIRFTNTEGPLFDTLETPEADGGTKVRLRNGTESALRIRKLPVRLMRDGAFVDARVEGLDLSQPLEMQPGQSVEFRAFPTMPLPGEGPADAVFDLGEVDILAQPDLVLPVVSDTSVPAEYVRAVEVMTLSELMEADSPDGPILLINVEFRTGQAVRLSKETQSAVAAVKLPLVNLLLGKDAQGAYDFRQQVIRRSGQTVDREWRKADYGVLVVPVTP